MHYYPKFAHIYVETEAKGYPWTERILRQFPKSEVIEITHYKDFFSRPGQDFQLQKRSQKLILAVKKDAFLYSGNAFVQDFGYENFHYNTPVLNCLYNCEYCYLQGMFASGNMVVFVNQEDFFKATDEAILRRKHVAKPFYLAISYDTDLMATESRIPLCAAWLEYAARTPDLVLEIRTKSAQWEAIKHCPASSNSILAWTLSPEPVIKGFEKQTPGLAARLNAAQKALDAGFPVRLCFDPVLPVPDWEDVYGAFLTQVFSAIDPRRLRDVSLGVFRMSKDYYKKAQRVRPDSRLFHYPWELEQGHYAAPRQERERMVATLHKRLLDYLPQEKIEIWK